MDRQDVLGALRVFANQFKNDLGERCEGLHGDVTFWYLYNCTELCIYYTLPLISVYLFLFRLGFRDVLNLNRVLDSIEVVIRVRKNSLQRWLTRRCLRQDSLWIIITTSLQADLWPWILFRRLFTVGIGFNRRVASVLTHPATMRWSKTPCWLVRLKDVLLQILLLQTVWFFQEFSAVGGKAPWKQLMVGIIDLG